MSASLIPVKLLPINSEADKENQVYFPRTLIKKLGINHNQSLHIRFGKKVKSIHLEVSDIDKSEIHMPETIINELLIPIKINNKFLVKYMEDNQTLQLGPVVALLTDFHSKQNEVPNFRSIHNFCKELQLRVQELGGFFYVFNIHDFKAEYVRGYYFENDNWIYSTLPLPDVIYNRVHSRRLEQIQTFTSFRSILEKLNIPLFNDRYLSKWEVYQHLMLEGKIQPFLPETRLFSHEALYDFIDKYDTVYMKPVHGSQGKNIIKLINEDKFIICQSSQNLVSNKYLRNEIFHHLKPMLHNKIYIIQQGIPLVEQEDRTMDFRVLVHKNQYHLWEVTSLVARISAEKQFVSNLAKGGEMMKPFKALRTYFDKSQSLKLISAMKELSTQAAATLSHYSQGIIGELGIDIGIDGSGTPWIIEVNSKPSKSFEDPPKKIRPSAKAIIQFCIILSFTGNIELEEKR